MGLSAGLSPGPLFTLVVSQSVRHGAREGMKVAVVPLLSDLPVIAVSMFLLTRAVDFRPALGVLSVSGALYLFFLTWESFRPGPPDAAIGVDEPHSIRKGLAVNLMSPYPYLFWVTVGGPMMLRGWSTGLATAAAFVVAFYACLVGSKIALAWVSGRSARLIGGKGYRLLMRVLGVCLAVFAGLLLKEGLTLLGVL